MRPATKTIVVPILALTALLGACGPDRDAEPPHFGEELGPIIEPVPAEPTVADEGRPGVYLALPGLEKPARGFAVLPGEGIERRGSLVLLPGSWGLVSSCRDLAREISKRGFAVVVPDLFEGVVPTAPLGTSELLAGISPSRGTDLVESAVAHLRDGAADSEEPLIVLGIGSSGFFAFEAARQGIEVDAVILDTTILPLEAEALRGAEVPVHFMYGVENRGISDDILARMRDAFEAADVQLEFVGIEMAATTLLDAQTMGHNPGAHEEVFEHLERIAGLASD